MISGLKTLRHIDQSLGSVRKDVNRIDAELNHASQAMHNNRRQQTQSLKQLAKIRLDEIAQGSFLGELDAADHRALSLLEKREQAYQQLEVDINTASERLKSLETNREAAQESLSVRAQAIIDCEHTIQTELEHDNAYQEQLQAAREMDSIADQAEEKAVLAEKDRQEKGEPYENNKLFMYLWKRKYGTSDYVASALIRYLDSWVEDLSDYDKYRVNYWTLLEIPKRLKAHAETARISSDQALEALAEIEIIKAQQAGLPGLQDEHGQAQTVIDAIDDKTEQQEDKINLLLKQRTEYVQAKDVYTEQSLQTLSAGLSNKSVYELNNVVSQTVSNRDNLIVRELAELQQQQDDLKEELQDHRRLHEAKLDRLKQLENVRRQFKNHRYDDVRSEFRNKSLVTSMFNQFLMGLVGSDELWRVLKRHQRHRDVGAWPDFGSGGLGVPTRRRSPWHLPSGRGRLGGSVFRLPKSGGFNSRSGGGFRTGGGF